MHVKGKRLPAFQDEDETAEPEHEETGEKENPVEEASPIENSAGAEENDKNVNDFEDSGDDKIVEKEINGNKDEKKH